MSISVAIGAQNLLIQLYHISIKGRAVPVDDNGHKNR